MDMTVMANILKPVAAGTLLTLSCEAKFLQFEPLRGEGHQDPLGLHGLQAKWGFP